MGKVVDTQQLFHCGTLTYTHRQIVAVFIWFFIGVFCYTLGSNLPELLLPVQLKEIGSSDKTNMIILNTIAGVLNMTVCPYIGVVSDWHRGKWGRRIPYIFKSMPPLVLALILFAFTNKLGTQFAARVQPLWKTTPLMMTVLIIGLVQFLHKFYLMWVGSVIFYLPNDIMPPEMFGGFQAIFTIATNISLAIFNYFVFPYAEKHMSLIYVSVSVLYLVGMSLMCWFVREGGYPSLTAEQLASKEMPLGLKIINKLKDIKEFFLDTFCDRFYIMRYILTIVQAIGYCGFTFIYFFHREIGLDNNQIGKMNGISNIITTIGIILATMFAVALVNRWHPVRIVCLSAIFGLASVPQLFRFIFGTLPPDIFVLGTIVSSVGQVFLVSLCNIAGLPFEMLTFPKSRFGTFCSMQAMLRSIGATVASLAVAWGMDKFVNVFPNRPEFRYRLIHGWYGLWLIVFAIIGYIVYRTWGKLGGYRNFSCPARWEPSGREPISLLKTCNVNPHSLLKMLCVVDVIFIVFTLAIPIYALWCCRWRSNPDAEQLMNYIKYPLAIALISDICWLVTRMWIARQARDIIAKPFIRKGLLQPGLLLVFLVSFVFDKGVSIWSNLYATGSFAIISLCLIYGCLLFFALAIAMMARVERDIPQPEDT